MGGWAHPSFLGGDGVGGCAPAAHTRASASLHLPEPAVYNTNKPPHTSSHMVVPNVRTRYTACMMMAAQITMKMFRKRWCTSTSCGAEGDTVNSGDSAPTQGGLTRVMQRASADGAASPRPPRLPRQRCACTPAARSLHARCTAQLAHLRAAQRLPDDAGQIEGVEHAELHFVLVGEATHWREQLAGGLRGAGVNSLRLLCNMGRLEHHPVHGLQQLLLRPTHAVAGQSVARLRPTQMHTMVEPHPLCQ